MMGLILRNIRFKSFIDVIFTNYIDEEAKIILKGVNIRSVSLSEQGLPKFIESAFKCLNDLEISLYDLKSNISE